MMREHNWAGNYTFSATRIHRPTSVDEVRRTVAQSSRIRAVGAKLFPKLKCDLTGEVVGQDFF